MSIIGGLRERTIPWFFGHFWKCPHAKIQLLLNTFKNGRKIKGSFLLWALQFYAGIHSIGYNLFFLSCGLIAVPEKPKTWAALAASRTPPAQSSSAPSTNSRPVRQAQQVAWKWQHNQQQVLVIAVQFLHSILIFCKRGTKKLPTRGYCLHQATTFTEVQYISVCSSVGQTTTLFLMLVTIILHQMKINRWISK